MNAKVLVVLGSDSDLPLMQPCLDMLGDFGIPYSVEVSSAHRSPRRTRRLVREAEAEGVGVIIAAAGGAAHLPGVIAAETALPVIGVPLETSPLHGIDALLAIAQMPPGVPVAAMAIGKWGAANAAILSAQVLAQADSALRERLHAYKQKLAAGVEEKSARLKQALSK